MKSIISSIRTQISINHHIVDISTSANTSCLVELGPWERTLVHSLVALSLALVFYAAWDPRIEGDLFATKLIEYNYNPVHY